MKTPYQDIWRDGKLVRRGRRDCAGRYEAIRDALGRELGSGFSVADVGGWDGYFPVRLSEDLGAAAENIDARHSTLRCHRQMKVTAETVGKVGYHDAILCLSVLHHMPDWREVYDGLKAQCKVLIIEVCHTDEAAGDSPVMKLTGERIGPVFEAVSADAEDILCETPCLDDKRILRPTYLVRGDCAKPEIAAESERAIVGVVESGTGKASGLMQEADLDWSSLGYEPFPGTLNVAVSAEDRDYLKSLDGVKAPGLRRSTHYVPVKVDDVGCHVHFARSPAGRPEKVIELVAPVCLRDLGYDDGAEIVVHPC